jgi:5-methylcytosine-specific restriction endonuclease McrA
MLEHSRVTSDPYKSPQYCCNRLEVLQAAGWRCQICGGIATTADHVLPLALGGSHDVSNLRPLCRRCDSRLGADLTNEIKARRRPGRQSRRWWATPVA